jgi:hypothetical protein
MCDTSERIYESSMMMARRTGDIVHDDTLSEERDAAGDR